MSKSARAFAVVALTAVYCAYVFQFTSGRPLRYGLSHWHDPYFINALLEHWYVSIVSLANPATPPMFFPAEHTLGYSHGLILFAPFYVAVRPFVDPFLAHTLTIFLTVEVGAICLYALLRRAGMGFWEGLVLAAFFVTSANVINGSTGQWSQRASVFLIPPILLLISSVIRMRPGLLRLIAGALAGALATSLPTQDFYTAAFAVLVFGLMLPGFIPPRLGEPRALAARLRTVSRSQWQLVAAFSAGAAVGGGFFLWAYLGSYREHPAFPVDQLWERLRRPTLNWPSVGAFLRDLVAYDSARTFVVVLLVALLAFVPAFRVDRLPRLRLLWLALVSVIVLVIPLRTDDRSVWTLGFAWLPGLSAIRDPKRIVHLYELGAVLALAVAIAAAARRSAFRVIAVSLVAASTVYAWNTTVFEYSRSREQFERWVSAPIAVDASCRSFFVKTASAAHRSRADDMYPLYGSDALFIALRLRLPTLNGYSAWVPPGYHMLHANDAPYLEHVKTWIADNQLEGVCALDIDARTMTPFRE